MLSKLERFKTLHRVAKNRGRHQGVERANRKLALLRRAKSLAQVLKFGETSNACHCSRTAHPHLHSFGACVKLTTISTARDLVTRLLKSHTFLAAGNPRTWKRGGVVHENGKYDRARRAAQAHANNLDKRLKAQKLLSSPSYSTRVNACATLNVSVPQTKDIWRTALHKRRGKSKRTKVAAPVRVYRNHEYF